MSENLNYIFQYLEKENIGINKSEFQFQIESHPDYPSIISISDTLSFFDISNGVISVGISELELLPESYIALLEIHNEKPEFYFLQRKDDFYICSKDGYKKNILKNELELGWRNFVLLIEKSETDNVIKYKSNDWFWIRMSVPVVFLIFIILRLQSDLQSKFFFIFPILGVIFSITALKDLFGVKNDLINKFCNSTSFSSCTSLVESKKWKIFKVLNFSDLSLVFFCSQFLGLLLFLFMTDASAYFNIQKIVLLCSTPILLASIYYQKFMEKKWCPICLIIIGIVLLELGYVFFLFQTNIKFQVASIITFGFIIASVNFFWSLLNKILIQQKKLKESQIKSIRFIRNYEIFKNNLLNSTFFDDISLSGENIILGNPKSPLKIIIVTSPFCGYCREAHSIIKAIIAKYPEKVCFDIRFNFNVLKDDEQSKEIHHKLISVYFKHGHEAFIKVLHDWFENKDENELNHIEYDVDNELKINIILEKQLMWNQQNNIIYTPSIIINGYLLPKQYDKSDLIYFINDLSDDEFF